jgi:tRNA nucleotidyltransferase (CCA-adding enzyme)
VRCHENGLKKTAGMSINSSTKRSLPYWEHFYHVADIGVRGLGTNREQAFEQAALAMTAVIVDPAVISQDELIELEANCPDGELLLVDWLNALIYEMATRRMLFSRFEVTIEGESLHGKAWGERVDQQRHQPAVEVKGATFTALEVYQREDGSWLAQCVVDV